MTLLRLWVSCLLLYATAVTAWNSKNLPKPESRACVTHADNQLDDVKLCDPDNTLPYHNQMITSELLMMCEEEAPEGAAVFLFLADTIRDKQPNENQGTKDPVDRLMERAVRFYNFTTQKAGVFMLVVQSPLQLKIWRSDALTEKIPEETLENAQINATLAYGSYKDFPSTVNVFIVEFCKNLKAGAEPRRKLSATDFLTVTFVVFYVGITVTLTVLLVRACHTRQLDASSEAGGDLRSVPGRHLQQNPLSLELHEFGAMATYTSTGHILLSTTDVAAVNATCASTERLLDT
ncbi:uncharacterized protein LOC122245282 [Penaeus japonicus]|uniref:uncharacterized protein LOC122245282 n=1 Tax=Penaeus japonicus TaxID=27405 RepID=UPI001C70BB23|nr:uncharacterized protein LOC122245282 [Penaeus japonicus]